MKKNDVIETYLFFVVRECVIGVSHIINDSVVREIRSCERLKVPNIYSVIQFNRLARKRLIH